MRKTLQIQGDLPTLPSAAHSPETSQKRRRFLFALSAGSAATAVPAAAAVIPTQVEAQAKPARSSGYRETDHVRDYYASTRL